MAEGGGVNLRPGTRLAVLLAPCLAVLLLLVAAYAVFLAVGFLRPVAGTAEVGGPPTFANYLRFVSDPAYWGILWRTVWFAALISLCAALIGYPMAYAIARTDSALLRRLLIAAVVVTFLSGSVTRAYGWLVILGNRGLLNGLMLSLGLREQPLQMVFNHTGVFVALLHFVVPFFVLTLVGTVRNVPRALEDAARNLGAGAWTTFRRVTLPLTLPGIVAGMTLCFGLGLSAFLFPLMLGGGRVRLMANFIYDEIFVSFNLPFAAATSAIFLVCALASLLAFSALQHALARQPARAA